MSVNKWTNCNCGVTTAGNKHIQHNMTMLEAKTQPLLTSNVLFKDLASKRQSEDEADVLTI
jgi:hypothetical protein